MWRFRIRDTHDSARIGGDQKRSRRELDPPYEQLETDALVTLLDHAQDSEGAVNVEFTVIVIQDVGVYIHTGEPIVAAVGEGQ